MVQVNVITIVAGVALVAAVAWDIMLTLLHPTARGPLSYVANRVTWMASRGISLRFLRGSGLSYAGPFAVVVNVLVWVVGLWFGYALIYLPFVESFAYDPSTPFAGKGILEALYLSGAAITTVGFGDVVPTGGLLRLVTVMEAASGFGVLSAAIAFVLSVYPLISQLRSTGLQLADAGALEARGAAEVIRRSGPTELEATVRNLTEDHEYLRRFPVLYYFESGNREESLSAVLRGSSLLLVAQHCASTDELGFVPLYAEKLEHAVARLLDDLERDFIGGRRGRKSQPEPAEEEPSARLSELCATLQAGRQDGGRQDGGRQGGGQEGVSERLGTLLARVDVVLEALAREHGHEAHGVLPGKPHPAPASK